MEIAKMNHEYHHIHGLRIHVVAQRDLNIVAVLNQSERNTTIKPMDNGKGNIQESEWYFQLWISVCDYYYYYYYYYYLSGML